MMDLFFILVHLCSWAQLGTLTRIYLGQLFGAAPCQQPGPWTWVPCVTSDGLSRYGGALFSDVVSNVLGSFIMGLATTSDILAMIYSHRPDSIVKGVPVAILPRGSPLQKYTAIQLGIRTGSCGSLTTFASWMTQVVKMMVGGEPSSIGTDWVSALCALFVGTSVSLVALSMGQHLALLIHAWLNRTGAQAQPQPLSPYCGAADGAAPPDQAVVELVVTGPPEPPPACMRWQRLCVDVWTTLQLLTLTGVSLAYAYLDTRDPQAQVATTRAYFWFSILFGPAGCLLRWWLSFLNVRFKEGVLSWFPLGTFLANQLACVIDFNIALLLVRLTGLSLTQEAVMKGLITGMNGCLSTVSTWVVEVGGVRGGEGGGGGEAGGRGRHCCC